MPISWPSMRSMARWVLPVLVGPRTAVTPRPRGAPSEFEGNGRLISRCPKDRFPGVTWNEGGTNLVRIADSAHSDFVPKPVKPLARLVAKRRPFDPQPALS